VDNDVSEKYAASIFVVEACGFGTSLVTRKAIKGLLSLPLPYV
jgi:hypothetical protein